MVVVTEHRSTRYLHGAKERQDGDREEGKEKKNHHLQRDLEGFEKNTFTPIGGDLQRG